MFYVSAVNKGYAWVTDTEDWVEEQYTFSQLREIASKVKIYGVENGKVTRAIPLIEILTQFLVRAKLSGVHASGNKEEGEIQIGFFVFQWGDNYIKMRGFRQSEKGVSGRIGIPRGVTCISEGAFFAWENLEEVVASDGAKITKIERAAFGDCKKLKNISLPDTIVTMEERVFDACTSLERIVLPKRLKVLKKESFSYCTNLKEVHFGESLTKIQESAFSSCYALERVEILGTVRLDEEAFAWCRSLKEVVITGATRLARCAFIGCEMLSKVSIREMISPKKRMWMTVLESMHGRKFKDVCEIEELAFARCTSLKRITLPSGVGFVASSTFEDCDSLEEVIFPRSIRLNLLSGNTFEKCPNLRTVYIPQGMRFPLSILRCSPNINVEYLVDMVYADDYDGSDDNDGWDDWDDWGE